MNLPRRTLLKQALRLGSTSLVRALLPPLPKADYYSDGLGTTTPVTQKPVIGFARALQWGVVIRTEPSLNAPQVGAITRDKVLPIYTEMQTQSGSNHNKLWYEVQGGYVFSANVHPVRWQLNQPVTEIGKDGLWVEVSVPFADPRLAPTESAPINKYRFYGGTVYKATKAVQGQKVAYTDKPNLDVSQKEWWYQIEDEAFGGNFFVPARFMRPIAAEEFTPLSPDIAPEEKKIRVKLSEQRLYAYEREKEVFTCRTATGVKYSDDKDYSTTPGSFFVFRKTPGQHMYGGAVGDDGSFDLPGVPWVSYFTSSGIAIHGTYWHNDYGVVRSHGCANVLTDNAKWFWRWTMPLNNYSKRFTDVLNWKKDRGTSVVVEY